MGTRYYPRSSVRAHYHGAGTLYQMRQLEFWKRGRLKIGAGICHVMHAKSNSEPFPIGLNDVGALSSAARFCAVVDSVGLLAYLAIAKTKE